MNITKMVLALALCVLLIFCTGAFAEEEAKRYVNDDYVYTLKSDGTAEIVYCRIYGETIEMATEVDGYTVTSIGEYAFHNCDAVCEIILPDTVTTIEKQAFLECRNLRKISLPDSLVTIGYGAFDMCDSLIDIYIPNSVKEILGNPFCLCFSFESIDVPIDHPYFYLIDGVLFDRDDKRLVCYPCALPPTSYEIPDGIKNIGEEAFLCNDILEEIEIPDGVLSIGDYAFWFCSRLIKLNIPDSVTSIGDDTFTGCSDSLTLTVGRDSYAKKYCIDHNLNYTYPDANDWLNS